MDFITGLPDINGFNALLVCVDKFGKLCRLIPCRAGENELSAPAIAKLFFEHVVRLYGVPCVVVAKQSSPQLSTRRLMVKRRDTTAPSNRLYEHLGMSRV